MELEFVGDALDIYDNHHPVAHLKGDKQMQSIVKNIHDEVEIFNETESREYKLSLSVGYAIYDPKKDTMDEFLKKMDDNMYQEKDTKHRR